ncbi:hypothetical protein FQA47_022507 [Oryzias melastigma]|uniref:Uncharacterized protein n=1 Tax=Oryzias melastigma TaxID=30732 RepID=A0A834CP88_ORYME|nr:hypothetical protein FQA47_022507 [Oryzias melastigma]
MEIRGRRWQEDAAGGGRVNAAAAVQAAQTRTLPERNSLLWTLFGPSDPDRNPVPPLSCCEGEPEVDRPSLKDSRQWWVADEDDEEASRQLPFDPRSRAMR